MTGWKVLSSKKPGDIHRIVKILLANRGITTKSEQDEFLKPISPLKLSLASVGIKKADLDKVVKRIKKAIKNNEKIIIYGDYDADGICATATLWEGLYAKTKNVLPYIPERFTEGYGINEKSIQNLKKRNSDLSLIITVDNGIVAYDAVKKANELGIDVIITDHHQKGNKKLTTEYIVHTTKIGGAGIAWILSRELTGEKESLKSLELAAIGTIADQIPLISANRSIVKFGLEAINKTKRVGLLSIFKEAAIQKGEINSYHVGFLVAPRLNAMGRMEHAIDSLRLLCTTNERKADTLSKVLGNVNRERQKIVEEVFLHARETVLADSNKGVIVVSHKSYHEGIVGLAASRLVEEFYRPTIVFSVGDKIAKASARSVAGFNIIEAIRKTDKLLLAAGGHPMAAGFSIETKNITKFVKKINSVSKLLLTPEILTKTLKVDCEIDFNQINWQLFKKVRMFEPFGLGNPAPSFATKEVEVIESKTVGRNNNHLKLKVTKDKDIFEAIAFGRGGLATGGEKGEKIDIVYNIDENIWNGNKSIQLKVKDLKKNDKK